MFCVHLPCRNMHSKLKEFMACIYSTIWAPFNAIYDSIVIVRCASHDEHVLIYEISLFLSYHWSQRHYRMHWCIIRWRPGEILKMFSWAQGAASFGNIPLEAPPFAPWTLTFKSYFWEVAWGWRKALTILWAKFYSLWGVRTLSPWFLIRTPHSGMQMTA